MHRSIKPGGLPMRIYLLPFALLAVGAWASAMAELPAPIERQDTVAQIDFDALHSQAYSAMEKLRQSRDRRMASSNATVF
jgi:hypothetical protein